MYMMKLLSLDRLFFGILRKLLSPFIRSSLEGRYLETLRLYQGADTDSAKPLCYVLRSRCLSDLLILEQACVDAKLPSLLGMMKGEHIEEEGAFFFLSHTEGLVLKRDRPHHSERLTRLLTSVEENAADDVLLVPVTICLGRAPDKEQSAFKLLFSYNYSVTGRFRRLWALLIHGRNTLVHFNQPLSLRELVDEGQDRQRTLHKLKRILRVHFRQQRAAIVGPDLSHRRTLVNSLLHSPQVKQAITIEAENKGLSHEQAFLEAKKYANEIASDFNSSTIRFLDMLFTWFWNRFYSGIELNHLGPVKSLAREHSIVYVPCHRSHIDYLLLSYVLYKNGLTPPHIAAGINLNMPLVGPLLRRAGAFFIRRSFKGNPLYSAVFNEYLHNLFTKGFSTEFFIEGGRSRTGRTLTPRSGMLSITLSSCLRSHRRNISFVPVFVGYERVLEGGTYLGELRGKNKKKETPLDIIRTLAALRNNFGRVRVNFGKPIDLHSFLDKQQAGWRTQDYQGDFRPPWIESCAQLLGNKIASHINGAAAINPVNMVAMALLSMPRQAIGEEALVLQLETWQKLLQVVPYSDHITQPLSSGLEMIQYVEKMNLLSRQSDSLGDVLFLEGRNAILMTYYRNNILHLFSLPSLICCLFLNRHYVSRSEITDLIGHVYPYIKAELFLRWSTEQLPQRIELYLDAMVQLGMLSEEEGVYHRPDSGSTGYVMITVLANALMQTMERYYMVISLLLRNGSGRVDAAALGEQCRDMAQRLSFIHGLNAPEFFDKSLFSNFIQQLCDLHLLSRDDGGALCYDQRLEIVMLEARKILPPEVRHSIRQVTQTGL